MPKRGDRQSEIGLPRLPGGMVSCFARKKQIPI